MCGLVSVADEDKKRCKLYSQFYEENRRNEELVDEQGNTGVAYWRMARKYVEPRLRVWREGRERDAFTLIV